MGDRWGTAWQDVRYGVRALRRSPGFTAVAVLTLALGIGANTAMFTVVNRVLLRPLPYSEADRIVRIYHGTGGVTGAFAGPFSGPDYLDLRREARAFDRLAAASNASFTLTGGGEPEALDGRVVSPGYFAVWGVAPRLGRTFGAADSASSGRVVVLSGGLWATRFGSDPSVIGRTIELNAQPYTVVGVMPPGFAPEGKRDLWTLQRGAVPESPFPADLKYEEQRGASYLDVVARLSPGVTLDRAEAELGAIQRGLDAQAPDEEPGHRLTLVRWRDDLVGSSRGPLLLLLASVGVLLLVACINIAGLMLAQSTARQRELNIRASLGASRGRLVQQLLTESVLLALVGGAVGLGVAALAAPALGALIPGAADRFGGGALDGRVLAFTTLVSVAAGIVFGTAPAFQSSRQDVGAALRDGGRGSSETAGRHRFRMALVGAQVALAAVLLVGAGLLLRSLDRLTRVDPGFHAERVLAVELSLPRPQYAEGVRQALFFQQLLERVRALPGVRSVGAVYPLPLTGSQASAGISVEGQPHAPGTTLLAGLSWVTSGYFRSMGIPLLAGRDISDRDRKGSTPVVVVNRAFEKRYFPDGGALGSRVALSDDPSDTATTWLTVVGVVGDVRPRSLERAPEPALFVPQAQNPWPRMQLVLRTDGEPTAAVAAVRRELAALDPNLPMGEARTVAEVVSRSVAEPRFRALLLTAFAALALVLSAIGIYAVIAFAVVQRTREIGVRIALGARPGDVVRMLVQRGLAPVLAGLTVGVLLALAGGRLLRSLSLLFGGVRPADPLTLAAVVVVLGGVALAALWIPARRATRIDPAVAFRAE